MESLGKKEEGNYQWGLCRAPTVICTLGVWPSQVPRWFPLAHRSHKNVPVAPRPLAHIQPTYHPSWDAEWVSHSWQHFPKEEATKATRIEDRTAPGPQASRGDMGTNAGVRTPQPVLLTPHWDRDARGVPETCPMASADLGCGSYVSGQQVAQKTPRSPKLTAPSPPHPEPHGWLTYVGDVELVVEEDRHHGHGPSGSLPLQHLESFQDLLILRRQLVLGDTL